MDVTRINFDSLVPEIEEAIRTCDFIAFDGEFTGIGETNLSYDVLLGTYEDFYHITKDKISPFQLIQVGLSLFKKVDDCKFMASVYNFYIFPQQNTYFRDVRKFLCQSASITFLSRNNFDFDKLFRAGIDYLTVEHENCFMSKPKQAETPINIISPKDKAFVQDVLTSVKTFLESNEEKMVMINKNGYYRKIFYQTLAESGLEKEVNYDFCFKTNVINITRRPKDEEFEHAMGFTRIVKALIRYQKPLIGHNCFLDILFFFKSFVGDLSQSYFEFKTQISKYFPIVFDTKLISEDPKLRTLFERNTLEDLDKRLESEPFSKVEFESNVRNNNKFHDAGYDSFITGKAFIRMIKFLCSNDPNNPIEDYLSFDNRVLKQYQNKIMVRIHRGQFINLFDEDQPLTRKDVFHLQVTSDKTTLDIYKLFEEFGGINKLIWKDDNQVFAILRDENRARDVLQHFVIDKNGPPEIQFQLYDDFIRKIKNNKRKFGKEQQPIIEQHQTQRVRPRSRSKSKSVI